MQALLGPLVGGLLAITGGLLVAVATHRREQSKWRRDAQVKAAAELLSALQLVVRRMINLAYQPEKRNEEGLAAVTRYEEATIGWNSAMYAAFLVSPAAAADLIPRLDREVDRLIDASMARVWSRAEFRQERTALGQLAADYLAINRTEVGLPAIALPSLWSWESIKNKDDSTAA
jgi:hypothetical protein